RRSEGQARRASLAAQHPRPVEEVIERFNAGDYRGCVEPLEVLWWRNRSTFIRALLRLCVALHQIRLGLHRSPRGLIRSAVETLSAEGWQGEGFDVHGLEPHLRALENDLAGEENYVSLHEDSDLLPSGLLRASAG
ncbi:MAG: DUF309 domain-containing protein, partial [Armatimonadetes bacterium]|nr:DUF309 domain-containing protein [Armatimonadota bacterium]